MPTPIRPPLTDVSALGVVLGIWAHPDDETLLSGGTMAALRAAGQRVVCVTATLGELGTDDPDCWPPERLRRVRRQELRAALAALDVHEHVLLGVPDGSCARMPSEDMIRRLVAVLRDVRPDTVLTFGPEGMTGHEDHQTVSAWATQAHRRAGIPARLLYATTTEDFVAEWANRPRTMPVFLADGLPLATPASRLEFSLPLSPQLLDQKMVALRAQATQIGPLIDALGEDGVRRQWSVETFISAGAVDRDEARWGTWRVAA